MQPTLKLEALRLYRSVRCTAQRFTTMVCKRKNTFEPYKFSSKDGKRLDKVSVEALERLEVWVQFTGDGNNIHPNILVPVRVLFDGSTWYYGLFFGKKQENNLVVFADGENGLYPDEEVFYPTEVSFFYTFV